MHPCTPCTPCTPYTPCTRCTPSIVPCYRSLRSSRWPRLSWSLRLWEHTSSDPCSGASTLAALTRSIAVSTQKEYAGTALTTMLTAHHAYYLLLTCRYVTQLTGGAATNDLLFTFNNPSVAEVTYDAML